jgi:N-acylneuraminate cytidylyltransferase
MISFFIPIKKVSRRVAAKNTKKVYRFKLGLTEIKINQLKKFRYKIKKDNVLKNFFFEYVISSDDLKIKNFLKNYPWIKFDNRPKKLARDDCLEDLIKHVPKICKGELILWTHVTSPLFNHSSYIKFIKKFLENKKNFDSAFTASAISSFIYNKSKKKWLSHNKFINKWPRTQDLDKIYSLNNAAFISKREIYTKLKDRIGNKPLPIESYENPDEIFDIDNKKDFNNFKKKFINRI